MQHPAFEEVTFQHHTDDATFKKKVRNTTILLSVITIIELIIGLLIYNIHKGESPNELLVLMFKGMVCILTLANCVKYWWKSLNAYPCLSSSGNNNLVIREEVVRRFSQ